MPSIITTNKSIKEMLMSSFWKEGIIKPKLRRLDGDLRCDVLIVGGGIAGILSAHKMRAAGIDCAVLEGEQICGSTTGNTTAKVTLQHGLIYHKITKAYGAERARMYLEAGRAAIDDYVALARLFKCDYEVKDSYVYSTSDREAIEREAAVLDGLGQKCSIAEPTEIPVRTVGAVRIPHQGQINPLKLLYGLAADLPIYEGARVTELMPGGAVTERGRIRAEKIVIATHFPILNKHGAYFVKMYQHRSYVLALNGVAALNGMYVDECDKGLSFRSYGNTLLLGGGGHRTGKRGGGWDELKRLAREKYPSAKITASWATQDCMTLDGIPYIGKYSQHAGELYVATGFNKWGMTSSMAAASVLTDMILGSENPYAEVFSPSRSVIHPQLASNIFESVVGLLTPTAPRCPHLGCALKYNKAEHTWDCPCHGSRFTEDGEVIDTPATTPKRKKQG